MIRLHTNSPDYNFVFDESIFDGTDWSRREPDQPFFAQV